MNFNLIHRGKLRPLAFLCELNKGQKEKEKKMDYKRNAKYFKALRLPPKGWLFLIGVIGVLFAVKPAFAVIGVLMFAAVLWFIYGGKPSDSEIDAQLNSFMDKLGEQALRKLGIDEEETKIASPLFLKGYAIGESRLGDRANMKLYDIRGKDGRWRSPECLLTAWYFTEGQIHLYQRTVSLVSDSYKEYTDEFFYKDVVSIKTDQLEKPWIDPKTGLESTKYKANDIAFMLRNTGGETTSCVCNSTEEADNAVNAMRSLIRQKKMA